MEIKILLCANQRSQNYRKAIIACGATPIIKYVPNADTDYDGLVLCGGNDVHPMYYNEEITNSQNIDEKRDEAELSLVKEFLKTGKPILGICRGFQLLNVALGGSLYQH